MKLATRSPVSLATGLLAALLLVAPTSASAVPDPTPDPPKFSLAVSPTRLVVGQDEIGTTQEIKVSNGGTSPMQVNVDLQNFSSDSNGTLLFQATAPYSASEWVSVSPMTFVIPAGETQVVKASIAVPPSPEPGDHQLALIFLVPAGETAANVRINRGVGMPVFVTVPGPTDDTVKVTGLDAGGFATGGPIDITATVENVGTVHRDFRDDTPLLVDVKGAAGPFPDFTVMRGSARDITTSWDPPLLCVCHATVSVINADGATSSRSVRVIVFPLPLVAMLLAGLLALFGLFWLARRQYRSSVVKAAAALRPAVGHAGV